MYLNFRTERDNNGDSWQRANPDAALIEQTEPNMYNVLLPGGNVHTCHYGKERGGYVGRCDCQGFEFGDDGSPCAHLCTLRKAEFIDADDDAGQPIKAKSTLTEIEAGREPPAELVADGGRPNPEQWAAGNDGRTFGSPESQL